ncbi:MAG: bifunctional UDP-N-acetylglucosamine diphosphorylase/glucosamine-1-phosphate N-acetyltransferase GlmU [Steroidobacteraceae bacterium]|jgi:bifunctional UDP-N-acetylglucosamine pyrophosphorylase/glucosamine-1-phosphate N-acetyltransferase|nr:bifunctional UDP-N-acetylglucosamine diphosphorylase/glucosamine-1-phosphate N-acetyltransferase GlmU [Steroidobacteraceae bacterium]
MPLSVVVLAAGQGKRMKSDLPKVLQPLAGRPLLGHVLAAAAELAPDAVHVVYGHGGEQVRAAFAGALVQWALQAEQHGTGHAVMQAMPAIPDDHTVLVLYGDVPLIRAATLRALLERAGGDALALLSVMLDDPAGYGRVLRDNAGNVYRIVEQKDATRREQAVREANTGILAAPAGALRRWLAALRNDNAQGEYYLTDVVTMAVKDGLRVEAVVSPTVAEVLGVNDKLQLAQLEAEHRRLRATELMLAGVTLADPARIDVRGSVEHGRDVYLDANVLLEGAVRLGHRVRIGPNVVLRDCEVGDDTVIHPNCVLEKSAVGRGCSVGPFARLRPGNRVADGAHIGNFVELKNTELGAGSKANHLSYLGDSVIGSKVNVGAGTITCNYDGANKYRTTIEDGAFIGSGTMLVAPVTVGQEATIGAGSTITKDAPAGKLTLERSKQLTIDGWKRPVKAPK